MISRSFYQETWLVSKSKLIEKVSDKTSRGNIGYCSQVLVERKKCLGTLVRTVAVFNWELKISRLFRLDFDVDT